MRKVEFWYEFASTYSYPAAMRIENIAAIFNAKISWQPFLLGPIFKQLGWSTSPFNLQAAKGSYMWRDLERTCQLNGLPPITKPVPFPQNSLLAARVALVLSDDGPRAEFSRNVFAAAFADARAIDDREVIARILDQLNMPSSELLEQAAHQDVRDKLKAQVARAEELEIFGAPMLVTSDKELFWGNDRLEDALKWETSICG